MLRAQTVVQWQMRSIATRCFFYAFRVCRSFLLASTLFLPQNVAAFSTSANVGAPGRTGLARRDASIASIRASKPTLQRNCLATKSKVAYDLDRLLFPEKPPRWRQDPIQWIRLLEPYLPLDLRNDSGSGKIRSVKPIHDISVILARARESDHGGLDLLCYLGVSQKRWKAVMWLVKSMSSSYLQYSIAKEEQERLQGSPWELDSLDLEALTRDAIWADDIVKPLSGKIDLESSGYQNVVLVDGRKTHQDREVMGQIWQSTAFMILQAADNPFGDIKSRIIMSHVFEILAHLHHIDAFPRSVYDYNPPADPSVPHKPPTLSLLSSQIMAILSDTAWRAQEYQISSETKWDDTTNYDGEKRFQGSIALPDFHVTDLGHGIWLDLVLWACIEGGWISEAAWIVSAIDSRKHDSTINWSVIKWDSIQHQLNPEVDWKMRLKFELQRFGVHDFTGIPRPGEGMQFCSLKMPPRTLSREVIAVLMDGLIITSPKKKNREDSIRRIRKSIGMCKSLLETDGQKLDPQVINSALLRLVGPEGSAIIRTPELLEELLYLSGEDVRAFLPPYLGSESTDRGFTTDSFISLGLMHQMLYCFARLDFVHGALRSFQMAREVVDMYNQQRLKDFFEEGKSSLLLMGNPSGSEKENEYSKYGTSKFKISKYFDFRLPGYVVVAFLDFVIRAELWELGKWLFYNDDVDGPMISSRIFNKRHLQPALLRFATATADAQLLVKVTEKLVAPLSESLLRALLHCQVAVGKWNSVQDLLSYFRDEPRMGWDASDAMIIATSILRIERSMPSSDFSKSKDVSLAFSILQRLLSGEFNPVYSRARFPDLSQFRLAIQINRILRKVPGKLSTLKSQYSEDKERSYAPVNISVEAFNILMKCIVDCQGSIAGKELWDMWCREVWPLPTSRKVPRVEDIELEQVIQPNLRTLRIILLPILRSYVNTEDMRARANDSGVKKGSLKPPETEAQNVPSHLDSDMAAKILGRANFLSESEREILQWGITMYCKFGITEKHLRAELTTHLLH